MKKLWLPLGLIIALFLFTRLYKITQTPPSLYWDETSIGYNAYSITQGLKDEWGKMLPVNFRAFGEFKLPVYIYTTAIFIKLFGFKELSVRLPAVLFSLGTVVISFFIAREITKKDLVAILSTFFVSVSGWFFIFTRVGYEASAGVMFFLLGIYLSLLAINRRWLFVPAFFSFICSIYSYNSFRIILPLFLVVTVPVFLFTFGKKVKKYLVPLSVAFGFLLVSLVPIYRLYKYDAGAARLGSVGVPMKLSSIPEIAGNYFSHFSPGFLFITGDKNSRSNAFGTGEIYLLDVPLFLLGLFYILKSKNLKLYIPFLLFIISPIPAAITKESPHALRAILFAPSLAIICAIGLGYFIGEIPKIYKPFVTVLTVSVYLLIFGLNFVHFISGYSQKNSEDWQYGYKEIFLDYQNTFSKYHKVVISDSYAQPYIFALFYLKYDPNSFRQTVEYNPVNNWGFSTVESFGKFVFKKVENSDLQKSTLIFASNTDKISGVNPVGEIKDLDGKVSLWVYSK